MRRTVSLSLLILWVMVGATGCAEWRTGQILDHNRPDPGAPRPGHGQARSPSGLEPGK